MSKYVSSWTLNVSQVYFCLACCPHFVNFILILEMSIKLYLPAEQLGHRFHCLYTVRNNVLLTRSGVLPQLCGAELRLDYPYYVQHLKYFPFSPYSFSFS